MKIKEKATGEVIPQSQSENKNLRVINFLDQKGKIGYAKF